MAKKAPRPRRRRRRQTWRQWYRAWRHEIVTVGIGIVAFGLFLLGTVHNFDKDEWIELSAMATSLIGVVKLLKELNG